MTACPTDFLRPSISVFLLGCPRHAVTFWPVFRPQIKLHPRGGDKIMIRQSVQFPPAATTPVQARTENKSSSEGK